MKNVFGILKSRTVWAVVLAQVIGHTDMLNAIVPMSFHEALTWGLSGAAILFRAIAKPTN